MTQTKRLTYVSPEPERQGHASYTHVHEIIKGLQAQGWQVNLYCPRYNDNKALPGVFIRLIGIVAAMFRAITAPRANIYYMRWHFAAFPVALYAKVAGIPIAIEVNGPVDDLFIAWPATRYFRGLFQWLMEIQLRWACLIVAVTDGLKEMCQGITDDRKTIVTIPNGANTDQFTPEAASEENAYTDQLPERFMVFFGTMAPWQGIGTVLAALEEPAWPEGVHAVFAGDGMERAAVEESAARLSYVQYLGRVPYLDLPAITARAMGSFVCTENVEGRGTTGLAPLKLFESMASGLPVIATELPFQAETVTTSACGYLVPPADATKLAETVAILAQNPVKAQEMSERSRISAVNEHSWLARARDTHDMLIRIIN